jgi:hypothetical protein
MAQTGTQDILKAIPTYDTPFLQPLAPSSAQTSSEMRLNTETAHISEGKSEEMRQKSPAVLIKPSGDSDDEVQLIFCAPRRKKRKKKRYTFRHLVYTNLTISTGLVLCRA